MSIADAHQKGYRSTSEEVWNQNPVCTYDNYAWPCDVAAFRAEVVAALVDCYVTHAEDIDLRLGLWPLADALGIDLNAELAKEEKP